MTVAIVGGGAVGITAANALSRRGANVTVFESDEVGHGASLGNAGLLVPSYSAPLATYQNLLEGLRSLTGMESAVHVRLMPSIDSLLWMAKFVRSANAKSTEAGIRTLCALTVRSVALFDTLLANAPAPVAYAPAGTLYVARTDAAQTEGVRLAATLAEYGIPSRVCTSAEARVREPALSATIAGAVWYPGDARLQPLEFVRYMAAEAVAAGAVIRKGRVTGIVREGGRVAGVLVDGERIAADTVVLAAGAWSPILAKTAGLRVPILPAKGYSIDFKLGPALRTSMLFSERHVSATPMNGVVRATTGLDFHGFNRDVREKTLQMIRAAYGEYLDVTIAGESTPWTGFRPLTPDGLPIVGPSSRLPGLVFATGHGPLGITLAPVTAELLAAEILDRTAATPPTLLPRRFGI